jgi:hypothetical protein
VSFWRAFIHPDNRTLVKSIVVDLMNAVILEQAFGTYRVMRSAQASDASTYRRCVGVHCACRPICILLLGDTLLQAQKENLKHCVPQEPISTMTVALRSWAPPSLNPNGIKIPADQAMVSIHFRLAKSCLYGQQFFVERIDTFHQRHG